MSQTTTQNTILALGVEDGRRFTERIPLITGEGPILNLSFKGNKTLYVCGHDAGFPDLVVKTDEKTLRGLLTRSKNKSDAKQVFGSAWKAIKGVQIDELYQRRGEDWQNFCDDIVIFLCCRQILFGTPIPVAMNPPTD
jgi:hypothetical protein